MKTWLLYGANGHTGRLLAQEAVRRGMRPILAGRSADEVSEALDAAGIANARLRTPDELTRHPQLRARRRWQTVRSPGGDLDALLPPVQLAGQAPVMGPVPALGEHTEAIRTEFGRESGPGAADIAAEQSR